MPNAAPKPCRFLGCGKLVADGTYCPEHKRPAAGSFSDPSRGSRHDRGYDSRWDKTRLRILKRDNGLCQECLRNGRLTLVGEKKFSYYCDHIVAKEEGGSDDDENLQALCRSCHTAKTDREKNKGRGASKV